MEHLVLIFWVIIILLSIISSIAKKKIPEKEEPGEEKNQVLERLLGVFSDEEQPQPVIPTPTKAEVSRPPQPVPLPQPPFPPQPRRRPVVTREDIIAGEKKRLLKEEMNLDLIRHGIVLSEILGPPRAEKSF
ncbi:hypothetical protein B9J77_01170 [candidate division NPL-UPA2 bacterium Unc8]|uniref:Uncharacterized protein n=1 Tax=candidate division NPL-UPA2 bacterium Unc8 TaxID=1980939 RepID=A0A399FZW5_UNCN2|nr:hypothetical protein [Bacillota bacterium]MBT9138268.1 hypothetical protein [Bacillota bacterium]MBT9146569.1 hypothetical protein [Bacillota bacterium]RII00663.1 MAG: hypothetical protein B9J77_01170 [candidate division NPL-UPA2 bacterium Unc8]